MSPLRFLAGGAFVLVGALAFAADDDPRPKDGPQRPDPARLLRQLDRNEDGVLDRSEVPARMKERFERMDADGDGKLTSEELHKAAGRPGRRPAGRPAGVAEGALFRLLDADGDGKLSRKELQNAVRLLDKLDRNQDGLLDRQELPPAGRRGGRPGEVITPAAKGERQKDRLKVGDVAPDFTLPLVSGRGAVTLSSFKGRMPVVLVFASYT